MLVRVYLCVCMYVYARSLVSVCACGCGTVATAAVTLLGPLVAAASNSSSAPFMMSVWAWAMQCLPPHASVAVAAAVAPVLARAPWHRLALSAAILQARDTQEPTQAPRRHG
jgi:hypothetical protein